MTWQKFCAFLKAVNEAPNDPERANAVSWSELAKFVKAWSAYGPRHAQWRRGGSDGVNRWFHRN